MEATNGFIQAYLRWCMLICFAICYSRKLQAPKQISDKIFKTVNVDDSYGVEGV